MHDIMSTSDRIALGAMPLIILVGAGLAAAGSHGGVRAFGIPLFALAVGLAFLVQWIAFVPAYLRQTEQYFDITGSCTYVAVTAIVLALNPTIDGRSILLATLVIAWAVRLGTYLFGRVRKSGRDARFDEIKPSFPRFLMTWTLQGLWVTFTLAAALAALTTTVHRELGLFALSGALVWVVGFAVEVVADWQKTRFRTRPENRNRFITTGLWARSRHPNYFGEIVIWIGVAIIALPVLRGWQWITLLSPVFVTVLLVFVSGVPLLERRADATWGGLEEYEAYKARTPVLIPRLWSA
jgi:steroid 5-alpha reductase family enzyme